MAIESNTDIVFELEQLGYLVEDVVAAKLEDDDSLTLYVDDRA